MSPYPVGERSGDYADVGVPRFCYGRFDVYEGVSVVEVLEILESDFAADAADSFASVSLVVHYCAVFVVEAFVDCSEDADADFLGGMGEMAVETGSWALYEVRAKTNP